MKRSNLYLLILVLMLGTAQYVHMKFSARMEMYIASPDGKSILDKVKLTKYFEEYGLGEFGEEQFRIGLKKGDQFNLQDTLQNIITTIKLIEDYSTDLDEVEVFQDKYRLGDCGDLRIEDVNFMRMMFHKQKKLEVKKISKTELFRMIRESHDSSSYMYQPSKDDTSLGEKLMTSPFVGFLLLLGFFLAIWLLDIVSNFLGRLLNQPQWKILCVLIFIPFFISFIKADIRTYQALIGTGEKWSNLFTWRMIIDFMLIPFVLLFFYFKNNFFDKLKFADGEAAKFGWLFLGVLGYMLAYGYVDALLFYDLEPNTEWTRIWNTVQNPAMALLVASGNFLNNFRKHFFQLKNKEQALEISKIKELESSSELEALQAKVNPHFLYNSLNSIASLAKEDPAKTEAMAMALSKFYKYSTNRQDELWATVESEIEMLAVYLEIEKIRFGERLQVDFNIDETTKAIKLPRFLLQPLVENAIKYGYDENTNAINVQVFSEKKENQLHLKIMDGGKNFSEEMNSGYGLRSVQKKLKMLFPEKHEIFFINRPQKGVFITIEL